MQTISINFVVPQGWHELSDKQLRYAYSLIASDFATDEVKTYACSNGAALRLSVNKSQAHIF